MSKTSSRTRDPFPIRYRVAAIDLEAHLFEVTLAIREPDPHGQRVSCPVWIPGSYLIREFARNIVALHAQRGQRPGRLGVVKQDKNTWQVAPCAGPIEVIYRVYAWDLSVRAAHLDTTHGFFNGTSLFLAVKGQEQLPCAVELVEPSAGRYSDWQVATALPRLEAKRHGFGSYQAANYDELIDHPVEMGTFALGKFKAAGTPHEIAVTGHVPNLDMGRLRADLALLCETHIRFFEPETAQAPFDRYTFLVTTTADGRGGLEHRSSTALLCDRGALPAKATPPGDASYRSFLTLASHEYFHSWNVKRIKPAVFEPYDLDREVYTSLLWLFEGFTSYYDDLLLLRSGLISVDAYLESVCRTIGDVEGAPGHLGQSVAESSFDAWIKYYRPDENTANAVVSYYKKGSLIALCLDLSIRSQTKNRKSLDDVMRLMWVRYGRDFYPDGRRGIAEDEFPKLVLEATGLDMSAQVRSWAYGTAALPIASLLGVFGVDLTRPRRTRRARAPALGLRLAASNGIVRVASVTQGGAAHHAGVAAGDLLVSIDRLRVTSANLEPLLKRYQVGDPVEVHVFRRDELMALQATLAASAPEAPVPTLSSPRHRLRDGWLH